eukprot:scaffold31088_cov75-Phaeocystis_antarctica.AAC.3
MLYCRRGGESLSEAYLYIYVYELCERLLWTQWNVTRDAASTSCSSIKRSSCQGHRPFRHARDQKVGVKSTPMVLVLFTQPKANASSIAFRRTTAAVYSRWGPSQIKLVLPLTTGMVTSASR